jgi:hypothetical protein
MTGENLARERYEQAWLAEARMDTEALVKREPVKGFDVCPCGHLAGHDHSCPLDLT